MLTFGKEVITNLLEGRETHCWHIDSQIRRGSTQSLNPPLVPLESQGGEKEEMAVLALTWSARPQSGTEANSSCVAHGAEVGSKGRHCLTDSKGIGCHYGTNNTEGESVLPLTKDSPDWFVLEMELEVGAERGKDE